MQIYMGKSFIFVHFARQNEVYSIYRLLISSQLMICHNA